MDVVYATLLHSRITKLVWKGVTCSRGMAKRNRYHDAERRRDDKPTCAVDQSCVRHLWSSGVRIWPMNGVNGVAGSVAVQGAEAAQVLRVSQLAWRLRPTSPRSVCLCHYRQTELATVNWRSRAVVLVPHIRSQAHSCPIISRKVGLFTFSGATHLSAAATRTAIVVDSSSHSSLIHLNIPN